MDLPEDLDSAEGIMENPEEWSEYWTMLGMNKSLHSEMVSQSGRISVLVFGGLLAVWSLCLHIGIFAIIGRRGHKSDKRVTRRRHVPLHWLVASSSLGQVCMIGLVLPVELMTEYQGGWNLGTVFCQWWRPIHIALMSLYFWGHFVITVERYLRCVRSHTCYRDGGYGAGVTLTCFAVCTTWLVSFVCAVVVTMVMRRHDALHDDVCAMSMSVNMAFVLAFTVYFTPVALTITASGALLFVRCQNNDVYSPDVSTRFSAYLPDPARRLAKSPDTASATSLTNSERGQTPEHNCASAMLIASAADADVSNNDLRISVRVALAANFIAITCWMPFYITNLMVPFCESVCVDPTLWTLFLWFGYSSVGLTPVAWFFEPTIRAKIRSAIA